MKKITLAVKESKLKFFLELIQSLDFVQINESDDLQEEIFSNVEEGLKELQLYKKGKLSITSVENFLNEL